MFDRFKDVLVLWYCFWCGGREQPYSYSENVCSGGLVFAFLLLSSAPRNLSMHAHQTGTFQAFHSKFTANSGASLSPQRRHAVLFSERTRHKTGTSRAAAAAAAAATVGLLRRLHIYGTLYDWVEICIGKATNALQALLLRTGWGGSVWDRTLMSILFMYFKNGGRGWPGGQHPGGNEGGHGGAGGGRGGGGGGREWAWGWAGWEKPASRSPG